MIRSTSNTLPTKGFHHDLLAIFDAVNQKYFAGKMKATIRWGRKLPSPQRRHKRMTMGHCHIEKRLITIHRAFDRIWVPRFIVEFVTFHEMLHLKFPAKIKNGRKYFHHKEFREAEATFADYAAAKLWEKNNSYQLHFF